MSLEIKSFDIENEDEEEIISVFQSFGWRLKSSQRVFHQNSTPRGAISYENLTYIHSETKTVDFTKLVFERDTNMPNYGEIVELEEKFWELSNECPSARPPEPKLLNLQDWVNENKPSAFSKFKKRFISFIFYLISGFLFGLFVYFVGNASGDLPSSSFVFILTMIISLLIVPIHLFVSKGLFHVYNCLHLKRADLENNRFIKLRYSEYVNQTKALQDAAISYDNTVKAMQELLWKSENLL